MKKGKASKGEKKNTLAGEIMSWIVALVFAVILAFIIKTFIFNTTYVKGNSMYPTLEQGDRLIAMKITLLFDEPDRGDIVIFDSPINPEDSYIKRVIAVEGDEVRLLDGNVYVNGKQVDEYYIEDGVKTLIGKNKIDHWKVGEDKLFVLGDNRHFMASTDSRIFGEISKDIVDGVAVFRYYPFDRIGVIK